MEDKEYIECEPQVFVGFSELGDKEYKKEKRTYCKNEVKQRKKRGKKALKTELNKDTKAKDNDNDKNKELIEKTTNQMKLNESTELLGNKRKNEDLINDIRDQMIKQKNNKSVSKEPIAKSPHKDKSEEKTAVLNQKIKVEKVKAVFYSDSKVNSKANESNNEFTNINVLIPKEKVEEEEGKTNQSNSNIIEYTAPCISLKSFPFPKKKYYFVSVYNLDLFSHSYERIKEILIKKSFPIQRLFNAKGDHNIIQFNLNNIPSLQEEFENAFGQTKLWYDPILQRNIERSNNILSYSRYDIVGVTIGKAVLLPQQTIYHLNPSDIINFRTVIVNLGPSALTHSIISSTHIEGILNYYQQQSKSNCINTNAKRKAIIKEYIDAMNIPIQIVNQSQYTILVLEPGMIHWCQSSLSSPSLFTYWSLCNQSISEYNNVSLISKQISSFNINPSVPLITLRFDMLNSSLDYLPLDSIKSYYYEMQTIISDTSLENYQQLLVESKIGLMSELRGTRIFFCDYCHNEIFNYYSVNRTKKKAKCMQCLEATVKKSQSGIIDPNVIIIYKYSPFELDYFLTRMKEKMVSCYDTNSTNSTSTTETNSSNVPYHSFRSISNRKQIYKENIELIKETEAFDNFAYSYETYSPYVDSEENQFNAVVNYDLISNYLITLIDRDKEKTLYCNPLVASNRTYPYSDFDNLNEDINLVRFSPSMKTNQMKKHKEGKKNSLGAMMLDLREKPQAKKTIMTNSIEINPSNVNVVSYSSKQESHLIGSSIFDFAKRVVSEKKEVKPINSNTTINTNMKVKCATNNKGNKYQFADNDDENYNDNEPKSKY